MTPITILIVDDHPLYRAGVHAMLKRYPHLQIVGEASDGAQAIQKALELAPQVILMDIAMPVVDGATATLQVLADNPGCAVLALTAHGADEDVAGMLRAGACGYILKDTGPEGLARAIEDVAAGRYSFDAVVGRSLVDRLIVDSKGRRDREAGQLTAREEIVLDLLARGYPNKRIAAALGMSVGTVKTHLHNVYGKLGVDSRAAAAARAAELGLTTER